jgi:hypothetical protein
MGKMRQDFYEPPPFRAPCQKHASIRTDGVCADCGYRVRLASGTWNVTRVPGRPHTRPNRKRRRLP